MRFFDIFFPQKTYKLGFSALSYRVFKKKSDDTTMKKSTNACKKGLDALVDCISTIGMTAKQ